MSRRDCHLGLACFLVALGSALPAVSQNANGGAGTGVIGTWREPEGSILRVSFCGKDVCAKLLEVGPSAPGRVDAKNPDAGLRTRTLCGLEIGTGFKPSDPSHAEDGLLYDPKSGKTYHGTMTAEGDTLSLRGYIGLKAFGRTEKWTRTAAVATCTK